MTEPQTKYDSPWKDILEIYFEDFLQFFFPLVHSEIDWTKPIDFLNKELKQVTRDAEVGRRYADTLAKVYRLNGQESYLYIHVEIQSQWESDLSKRIFIYNNRISEQYDAIVESLVVLGDDNINWRPQNFSIQGIAITKEFTFPIVKLLDYRERWSQLEADRNPFATVVMVHLKALDTRSNRRERKESKLVLIKRLYEQGFQRQDIINLYGLIDWMMTLPNELQAEFNREIIQYEEEKKVRYITSIEREAELKGEQKVIIRLLNQRIGEIKPPLIEQIRQLSLPQLEELTDVLLTFSTVAHLEQWLQSRL